MKLFSIQKSLKIFTGVKFALVILSLIAIASSLGSFLEQEEGINFYQKNYPLEKPIFGIITWKLILQLGLDHVYRTWWFFCLLFFLVISLISCFSKKKKIVFGITFLYLTQKYFLFE